MVLCQLGDPSCLSSVQLLWESEVLEVLVIGPDFHILGGAHEVVVPFEECEHDGKQFLVLDLVVLFSRAERLQHERYWVPYPILLLT